MIFGLGFVLPIFYTRYVEKQPLSSLGLTLKTLAFDAADQPAAGRVTGFLFLQRKQKALFQVQGSTGAVVYIMVAGIFEMLFFLRLFTDPF